ncbi:MAG: hypothetical protein E6I91_19730 [Chloroflexi bacterium]|nr:MAG: hypothetical protein E6I91_19730 [Chloroflexota bacterium]
MITSTSLSRMSLAGKLCRHGAWIITAAGLAVIIFLAVTVFYPTNQASSGLDFKELFNACAIALLMAIPIFFFSLILYAMGTLLDYVSTEKNTQEVNDERVEIISLPKLQ